MEVGSVDGEVEAVAASACSDDDLHQSPPFLLMLLTMLHYNRVKGNQVHTGMYPDVAPTKASRQWHGIMARPVPTEISAVSPLPGVYVTPGDDNRAAKRARRDIRHLCIPPSIRRMMQGHATRKHGQSGTQTLYSPVDDDFVMQRAVNNAIVALSVAMNIPAAGDEKAKVIAGRLPLSGKRHNDLQLEYDRVSERHPNIRVPTCCYNLADDDCSVSHLACSGDRLGTRRGALQMYLTPEQQRVFDATGEVPIVPGPCFLCICRDVLSQVLLSSGDPNPELQTGRYTIVPPFTVPVNQHDGYRMECCVQPSRIIAACVPMPSGDLFVQYNPETKKWRVNQDALAWTPTVMPSN